MKARGKPQTGPLSRHFQELQFLASVHSAVCNSSKPVECVFFLPNSLSGLALLYLCTALAWLVLLRSESLSFLAFILSLDGSSPLHDLQITR